MLRKYALLTEAGRLLHRQSFLSSSHNNHSNQHEETLVTVTNPLALKELRGYEHIEKLSEREKSYSPLHTTTESPLAAYSFFALLPYAPPHAATRWRAPSDA
jgi:hypothetical protein